MRFRTEMTKKKDAVIIADPNFDLSNDRKDDALKRIGIKYIKRTDDTRASLTKDPRGLWFKRLKKTKDEADIIYSILKESYGMKTRKYLDDEALEEILYNIKDSEIIHIATHGFFLTDQDIENLISHRVGGRIIEDILNFDRSMEFFGEQNLTIENPMLRSGIALAGANISLRQGKDDGIVTAEKISGLNLRGTRLVVLSACDTGLGEVKIGEGVFGLKRSFMLAGADTLVMSLWKVPNEATKEMMIKFYRFMGDGKSKAEALREAKLSIKQIHWASVKTTILP